MYLFFFFFSSRRRHTRFDCDWSSDVCSSDLIASLNDGAQEHVEPATLRIGPGDVPYCAVKGGTFEARFSRAAAFQLLGMADYDERTGRGALRDGARSYELRRSA